MKKYLIYNPGNKKIIEFLNWKDVEDYMFKNPNCNCRKITSKKDEERFREHPVWVPKRYDVYLNGKVVGTFDMYKDAEKCKKKFPRSYIKGYELNDEGKNKGQDTNNNSVRANEGIVNFICKAFDKEIKMYEINDEDKYDYIDSIVIETEYKKAGFYEEANAFLKAIEYAIKNNQTEVLIIPKIDHNAIAKWINEETTDKVEGKKFIEKIIELKNEINIRAKYNN